MTPRHIDNWSLSPKNNKIELFHSPTMELKPGFSPILMMGGVHGDEPEGVALAEGLLEWLKKCSSFKSEWVLIPCLNIDGYLAHTRVNGRGVDLNRNYPSSNWSPEYKEKRYFPGEQAGSEPEIQAVTKLIQKIQPRLIIHFHSWKPMIVLTGPPELPEALALSSSCGYKVHPEIGYPTPGSLSHYGWIDHKIPVICIEEQDELSDLSTVWPRFQDGFESIFHRKL